MNGKLRQDGNGASEELRRELHIAQKHVAELELQLMDVEKQGNGTPASTITKRKASEAENSRLLDILESSRNEIFVFDADTMNFSYMNSEALRNIGYTLEEMSSMTPADIKPEYDEASFDAAVAPLYNHKLDKLIFETVHERKDGSTYPVEIHLQLIERPDERVYLAVINDITERKTSEDENSRLLDILESSRNEIFVFDADTMNFSYMNSEALRNTGYTLEEMSSMTPADIKPEYDEASFDAAVAPLYNHELDKLIFETVHERKDGSTYPVEIHLQLIERPDERIYLAVINDITERKTSEDENSRLLDILESSRNEIFVFDADTMNFSYLNSEALGNIGYTLEEMSSMTPADIKPEYDEASFDAAVAPLYNHKLDKLIFETVHERKDGSTYPVEIYLQLIEREDERIYLAVINDITERKKNENENSRLLNILESSRNEIFVFDADTMNFSYLNSEALGNVGYTLEEMSSMTPADIKPEYDEASFDAAVAPLYNYELDKLIFETVHERKDGSTYPVEIYLQLIEHEDERVYLAVINDITERKKIEGERERLIRELEDSLRFKDLFLATMSHELRTPLNAMIGFQNLMMYSGQLDDDNAHMAKRSLVNSQRLLTLVNNILDLSRIATGGLEIVPRTVSIPDFTSSLYADMQVLADEKKLELRLEVDPALPESIFQDDDRLGQIVINLTGNAIKFTDTGMVEMAFISHDDKLRIRITDTGAGIPQSKQALIFDDFFQVDGASTRKHQGAGLGLAIVKRLSLLMGGTISLTSEPDEGSIFEVDVPLNLPGHKSNPDSLAFTNLFSDEPSETTFVAGD